MSAAPGAGLRRAGPAVLVLSCFAVLACCCYLPVAPLSNSRLIDCACNDPIQQSWFLAFGAYALTHLADPFYTTLLNAPRGANLAQNTTMPLLSTLATPITEWLGPVAALNLVLRASMFTAAASCYLVARRARCSRAASFLAGLAFGFSPYEIGQGIGHANLAFTAFVPLVLALFAEVTVRQVLPARRGGALLGLALVAQYLVSPELFADALVVCFLALVLAALTHPRAVGVHVRHAAIGLGVGALVTAVLIAWPVAELVLGPGHVTGTVVNFDRLRTFRSDLLASVVPTTNQLLAPASWRALGDRLSPGGVVENGSYLGPPLLVASLAALWFCRRRRLAQAAAWCALVALVLSLGDRLVVDGRVTGVPLPFAVLEHIPLLRDGVASRYTVFVQLGAALLLAVGVDRARAALAHRGVRRPGVVALGGLALLAPLIPSLPYPSAPTQVPALFTTAASRAIAPGTIVLTSPFPVNPGDDAMLWQAETKMAFRLVGGNLVYRAPDGSGTLTPPVLPPWYRPHGEKVDFKLAIPAFIRRYRVGAIVDSGRGEVSQYLGRLLASVLGPPRHVGGVDLWTGLDRRSAVRGAP